MRMSVRFEVDSPVTITGRGVFVFARLLDADALFNVPQGSMLGGVAIHNWLEIPRVTDEKGNQRLDVFAFHLIDTGMKGAFKKGQVVELVPGHGPDSHDRP